MARLYKGKTMWNYFQDGRLELIENRYNTEPSLEQFIKAATYQAGCSISRQGVGFKDCYDVYCFHRGEEFLYRLKLVSA